MADLLNYRKEDSDMNYNINEQKLGFDRVLPWEGQVPALVKEGEHYFLQVKAPEAENVTFTMNEEEFPCTREDDGIWRMEYTLRTGIQYVQLKIDDVEVVTPLLPITYGYSRPYNYVALEMKNEEFYQVKDVPHGSVRREYFFSKVTGEWERRIVSWIGSIHSNSRTRLNNFGRYSVLAFKTVLNSETVRYFICTISISGRRASFNKRNLLRFSSSSISSASGA